MFVKGGVKDKDGINEDETLLEVKITHTFLYQSLKSSTAIGQTERHAVTLIESEVPDRKSSLTPPSPPASTRYEDQVE